jgi:hypothetical protein
MKKLNTKHRVRQSSVSLPFSLQGKRHPGIQVECETASGEDDGDEDAPLQFSKITGVIVRSFRVEIKFLFV